MSSKSAIVCLLMLLLCPAAHAQKLDRTKFDKVAPSTYTDMLRNAALAYGAKSYDKSFSLFQRTACAGDKQSQAALGRMYMLGQGVERDDLTGYAWLKLAAEVLYPKNQSIVRQIEEAMTPEQRSKTDILVADLSSRYGLVASGMSCTPGASKGGHIIDQIICKPQSEGMRVLLRKCDLAAG